nr:hypothetical protein Itr_chr04CG10200 [Ipomoea trifida]
MTMAGLLQYKFFPTDFLIFPQKNSSIPKDTIHQLSPPGKPQQEQAAVDDESKVLGNGGETMKGKMVKVSSSSPPSFLAPIIKKPKLDGV